MCVRLVFSGREKVIDPRRGREPPNPLPFLPRVESREGPTEDGAECALAGESIFGLLEKESTRRLWRGRRGIRYQKGNAIERGDLDNTASGSAKVWKLANMMFIFTSFFHLGKVLLPQVKRVETIGTIWIRPETNPQHQGSCLSPSSTVLMSNTHQPHSSQATPTSHISSRPLLSLDDETRPSPNGTTSSSSPLSSTSQQKL